MSDNKIPVTLKIAIENYVKKHIPPNKFLRAVLENDLRAAVFHSDQRVGSLIPEIVRFVHLNVPLSAFGSHSRVGSWLETTCPTTALPPKHPCPRCGEELYSHSGGVSCQQCGACFDSYSEAEEAYGESRTVSHENTP